MIHNESINLSALPRCPKDDTFSSITKKIWPETLHKKPLVRSIRIAVVIVATAVTVAACIVNHEWACK
jgi:hypothetical protein